VLLAESDSAASSCTYTECSSRCSEDYRTERIYDCCYTTDCYAVGTSCDHFGWGCGDFASC
jgi:hypothetical protein